MADSSRVQANLDGKAAERAFERCMRKRLDPGVYTVTRRPKDLLKIFDGYGIQPNFKIRHEETRRSIFVEITRQNDRGNAYERSLRFLTPGAMIRAREICGLSSGKIPVWWVFMADMTRETSYIKKIRGFFTTMEENYFLWDGKDERGLVKHFQDNFEKEMAKKK